MDTIETALSEYRAQHHMRRSTIIAAAIIGAFEIAAIVAVLLLMK